VTFNHGVEGSSPSALTIEINNLVEYQTLSKSSCVCDVSTNRLPPPWLFPCGRPGPYIFGVNQEVFYAPSSRPGSTRWRGITTNSRWPFVRMAEAALKTRDLRRTPSPKHLEKRRSGPSWNRLTTLTYKSGPTVGEQLPRSLFLKISCRALRSEFADSHSQLQEARW
jgi:hypothetical protein